MDDINYTIDLPTKPPEGLIDFLHREKQLDGDCLVYRVAYLTDPITEQKEKCIEIKCTACGETFYEEYVAGGGCHNSYAPFGFFNSMTKENITSHNETLCPQCGAPTRAIHIGNLRYDYVIVSVYPITVQVINGKLSLLAWYVKKEVNKIGETSIKVMPYEGYLLDGKRMIKLVGYTKSMSNMSFFGHFEQRKKCQDSFGAVNLVMDWDPAILNGTDAENCKLDVYMNSVTESYPITYLKIWQKHKNVENLIMQGAGRIVNDKIKATTYYDGYYGQTRYVRTDLKGIDWKQLRPAQMLGLTKDEYNYAISHKWDNDDITFYYDARAAGCDLKAQDVLLCKYEYRDLRKLFDTGVSLAKVIRYIQKQKVKYSDRNGLITVSYLIDYWDMAQKIRDDLDDMKTRYPQNLIAMHDQALKRQKYAEKKELIEKFIERFEVLSSLSYRSETYGLEIRPAASEKEMIVEGKLLDHCIARYTEQHAKGSTAIFFIRKINEPDTPFFTLEYDEKAKKVRQNRGLRNCDRTEDVKAFEAEWIDFVKTLNKKEKKQNGKYDNSKRRIA